MTYSVWVGGVEINDYALTLKVANEWAREYTAKGHQDVAITLVDEDWDNYKFTKWEDNNG